MEELSIELQNSPQAKARFEALPPSHQREHLKYIEKAQKLETRKRRAQKTIETLLGNEANP